MLGHRRCGLICEHQDTLRRSVDPGLETAMRKAVSRTPKARGAGYWQTNVASAEDNHWPGQLRNRRIHFDQVDFSDGLSWTHYCLVHQRRALS